MKQMQAHTAATDVTKERRNVSLPIRWKASELAQVRALAASANADLSDYVRASALRQPARKAGRATGDRQALIAALGQLGKIGSNVNQLAKAANMGHPIAVAEQVRALQAIEQCADVIRGHLQNPELW